MFRIPAAAIALAALSLTATAASAQIDPQWYVRVGPALVDLDEDASMTVGGGPFPGGNVSVDSELSVAVEVGRFVTPNIAVSFTGGWPPNFVVEGAGSAAALGKIGEIKGGPASITGHYHFNRQSAFQPYIGGGVAFMYVFGTEDGALTDLEVENAAGPAVQVGFDYLVGPKWGVFADYKKAWFDTEATGRLATPGGPAPVVADVQLDPAVYNVGVSFKF